MRSLELDEITYPFPYFSGAAVEFWKGLVISFHPL